MTDAWLQLPAGRAFYEALLERETSCAWRAEDVITLIAGECDLILMDRPNSHGYEGLTQIGKSELRSLGWRVESMGAFCKAAPHVQIEYTGRYFNSWRERLGLERWESAGHLWAANLAPAHSKRVDRVVYSEIEHPAQYRANRWLDLDGDRVIEREELDEALRTKAILRCRSRYDLAIANLAIVRAELLEIPEQLDLTSTRGVQQALADLGYLPAAWVDGKPGAATTASVRAFQKRAGLKVDGVAGSRTRYALQAALDQRSLHDAT